MTASPTAATPTPHPAVAPQPAVALEVDGVPPGTTNAELAALFSPSCSVDKVLVVFDHASGGGSGDAGSALVLLRPSATAGADAQVAAGALCGHHLGSSSLSVRVCSSPAAWVQRALGPQVRGACKGTARWECLAVHACYVPFPC